MTVALIEFNDPDWPEALQRQALLEGWDIFECYGTDDPFQLQRIDDPQEIDITPMPTFLEGGDEEAWEIVWRVAGLDSPLHCQALWFLRTRSPGEYERIRDHCRGVNRREP